MNRQELFKANCFPSYGSNAYEIWFAVIFDHINKKALWLRYTILFPNNKLKKNPIAVMWASFFDSEDKNNYLYTAKSYPLDLVSLSDNKYSYPNGDFNLDKLSGNLETSKGLLSWNLNYKHQFEAFSYVPSLIKNTPLKALVKTHSASCSPFAKVNGSITLNKTNYFLDNASGLLTHIWGKKRVEELFWVFVPIFDNDGGSWALEIASVRLKPFLPRITVVKILEKKVLHYDNSLFSALSAKVKVSYPYLEIKATCKNIDILVKASLNLEQTTPYLYRDPDGKPRYIEQSDISQVFCTLKKGSQTLELTSKKGAAVEFHGLKAWSKKVYLDPYNLNGEN
jgi:hypothetical protein